MKNWLSVPLSLFTDIRIRSADAIAACVRLIKDTMYNTLFLTVTGMIIIAGLIVYVILPPLRFLQCNGGLAAVLQEDSSTDPIRHVAPTGNRTSCDTARGVLSGKIESDDSIGVIIDLRDSLLMLTCHNVLLRTCRFTGYNTSASWKTLCASGRICAYLSSSFILSAESATIPKIPITVKKAPRDTIAAAKDSFHDTCSLPKRGDIAITMRFNKALTLNFFQSEAFSIKTGLVSLPLFFLTRAVHEVRQRAENTIHGKLSETRMVVSIQLSHDDAGILYRAFPLNGKLAMYL